MSFGEGDLHERVERLENALAIAEDAASNWRSKALARAYRIYKLERENKELWELVNDMYYTIGASRASVIVAREDYARYGERLSGLGIEVER